ncbi:hypothetical protein [Paraburkholderia nodosa]|uniref:hypothetical protein n=1 Tax=Paraburkholderia nodosa TaxID=392320 RepID=UPI0008417BA1|nr:hypothetical protein [Paraburkholderia nodosa]
MSRFTAICVRVLLAPAAFWQVRASGQPDDAAPSGSEGQRERPNEAERLERIAMYARAGYFHMGCTLDTLNMTGEIPPE